MKKLAMITFLLVALGCNAQKINAEEKLIETLLDKWHLAAADANFNKYFSFMSAGAIYIGTDATEYWNIEQFKSFAKPYFDRGKAWNFTAIDRNIYLTGDPDLAYFDELLNTQMKICRGSGVLKKENGQWKIIHYVLSMTIPNDNSNEVVKIKSAFDDAFMKKK